MTYVLTNGVALPLPRQYITNGYVDQGVDYAAPGGTPEYAMGDGVIIGEGISGFGPNAPILQITSGPLKGLEVYYGHAGPNVVHVGQHVTAGQQITEVGYGIVGISTGPHLEVGFYPPGGMGAGSKMLAVINGLLSQHPTGRAWGASSVSAASDVTHAVNVSLKRTRPVARTSRAHTSTRAHAGSSGGVSASPTTQASTASDSASSSAANGTSGQASAPASADASASSPAPVDASASAPAPASSRRATLGVLSARRPAPADASAAPAAAPAPTNGSALRRLLGSGERTAGIVRIGGVLCRWRVDGGLVDPSCADRRCRWRPERHDRGAQPRGQWACNRHKRRRRLVVERTDGSAFARRERAQRIDRIGGRWLDGGHVGVCRNHLAGRGQRPRPGSGQRPDGNRRRAGDERSNGHERIRGGGYVDSDKRRSDDADVRPSPRRGPLLQRRRRQLTRLSHGEPGVHRQHRRRDANGAPVHPNHTDGQHRVRWFEHADGRVAVYGGGRAGLRVNQRLSVTAIAPREPRGPRRPCHPSSQARSTAGP